MIALRKIDQMYYECFDKMALVSKIQDFARITFKPELWSTWRRLSSNLSQIGQDIPFVKETVSKCLRISKKKELFFSKFLRRTFFLTLTIVIGNFVKWFCIEITNLQTHDKNVSIRHIYRGSYCMHYRTRDKFIVTLRFYRLFALKLLHINCLDQYIPVRFGKVWITNCNSFYFHTNSPNIWWIGACLVGPRYCWDR